MNLGELSPSELNKRLRNQGLQIRIGPFLASVTSGLNEFVAEFQRMFCHHEIVDNSPFSDFHVQLSTPRSPRRSFRPQVGFYVDGRSPFKPLPRSQAFPLFEWGMNWCISTTFNTYLIFHAAALERNGRVIILPGDPGAGKSTLAAALSFNGWRLFSDELALFDIKTGLAVPVTKTISLKNESIEVIRNFIEEPIISKIAYDTVKGTVAHLRPPEASVRRIEEHAGPGWLVFPRYMRDSATELTPLHKGEALVRLARNAFNYSAIGERAFEMTADIVDACDCFEFQYSNLDDGIATLSRLAG